ncbi:MAG: hypothetical protein U0529_04480 [Thermoanaerobaculia bacterium]
MRKTTVAVVAALAAVAVGSSALATQTIYKEFKAKESEAKCSTCHVEKMPTKDKSALNDFGKSVKAAKGADGKIDWTKVHYKAPAPGVAP